MVLGPVGCPAECIVLSGVEEGVRGVEPPSCDLMGAEPANSNFFGIKSI